MVSLDTSSWLRKVSEFVPDFDGQNIRESTFCLEHFYKISPFFISISVFLFEITLFLATLNILDIYIRFREKKKVLNEIRLTLANWAAIVISHFQAKLDA